MPSNSWVVPQDRVIRFDTNTKYLNLKLNEQTVYKADRIEDAKGNENKTGTMVITNLRFMWYLHKNKKINLSVGYDTITKVEIKSTFSA